MKKHIYLLLFLFILSLPVYTQHTTDVFKQNERLGKGGNFGNILYTWNKWDKEHDRSDMDKMKEIGMTGIRINTRPFLHMNRQPGYTLGWDEANGRREDLLYDLKPPYTISKEFFERLDWTVHEALDRGFTVIIDNHQYRVMGKDPMALRDMFLASWEQMAEHYKDYPDNVFFGVLNEPNGNLTPYLWNYFMMDAWKIIRESNPDRTLVIGPGDWNNIEGLAEFKLPENDRNIIVEIHYYSPHRFTHQGVDGRNAGITWGTPEDFKAVENDFNTAVVWAEIHNCPLFLGEFGVSSNADQASTVKWLHYVVSQALSHGISWSMWDLMGSGMGIYDDEKETWINPRKNAILPEK